MGRFNNSPLFVCHFVKGYWRESKRLWKKIAVTGIIFEDPEGQPKLPLSLSTSLTEWKRPHECLTEQNVYIDGSNKRLDR